MEKREPNGPLRKQHQRRVIAALIRCPSIRRAAKKAGVNRGVVYRWFKKDAAFREAYHAACDAVFEAQMGALRAASAEAVSRLRGLLRSKDERIALDAIKEAIAGGHDAGFALRSRRGGNGR